MYRDFVRMVDLTSNVTIINKCIVPTFENQWLCAQNWFLFLFQRLHGLIIWLRTLSNQITITIRLYVTSSIIATGDWVSRVWWEAGCSWIAFSNAARPCGCVIAIGVHIEGSYLTSVTAPHSLHGGDRSPIPTFDSSSTALHRCCLANVFLVASQTLLTYSRIVLEVESVFIYSNYIKRLTEAAVLPHASPDAILCRIQYLD